MGEDYDYLFKCIVVGDGGVGKTALTLRFSKGFFMENYKMTIGVDFHVKTISVDGDEGPIRAKLQIWDTGGQERFSSIRPMYYRGALGALLIFDLTSISSFEHLPQWIEEVRANVETDIPLLLVGNKNDLIDQRVISLEEINDFTRDFNLYYMETSAKTGDNVGDCFSVLACLMIGEGVPDKLIGDVIYAPGQIPVTPQQETLISPEEAEQTGYEESVPPSEQQQETFTPEPTPEYTESPEPEPQPISEPEPISETQYIHPQEQYSQPEPTTDSTAPPEPQYTETEEQSIQPETQPQTEPTPQKSYSSSEPIIFEPDEQEVEPEIPIPEPQLESTSQPSSDFEFKTPDEIMAEDQNRQQEAAEMSSLPEMPTSSSTESYKPKSVPFSSGAPVPTDGPEEFGLQKPGSGPEIQPEQQKHLPTQSEPQSKNQTKQTKPQQPTRQRESLFNYMPKEPESKEESKRGLGLFSRRRKKEKEEQPIEEPKAPSLLDTLSGKNTIESGQTGQKAFIPFSTKEEESHPEEEREKRSKLRIIPNAENLDEESDDFIEIPASSSQKEPNESSSRNMITCPKCGARLSSEYAFCNKCGSKL